MKHKPQNDNSRFAELSVDGHTYRIVTPRAETDCIQKRLHRERVPHEHDMLQDMASRLKPGQLVLDIGAHIGNHAMYLAAVAACDVVAFESDAPLANAIKEGAKLNGLEDRIRVEDVALGKPSLTRHSERDIPDNPGNQEGDVGEGHLPTMSLDDYTFPKPVAAIRIDADGMELGILEGARRLIHRDQPLVYAKCQTGADFAQVHNWLAHLGFGYWDSFSQTSTHLFMHDSQVEFKQRIERILFKLARDEYAVRENQQSTEEQIAALRWELEQANAQRAAAERQVANLRSSRTYQLGYHLRQAGTSWRGLVKLPLALWRIFKQKQARKAQSAVTAEQLRRECATLGWIDPAVPIDDSKPKILAIMDEFTTGCFAPDCNLIQPRPDNWEPLAELLHPDLIFVESAWKGNGGTWQYRIGTYANKPGRELEAMAEYAREHGIPFVFWSKEDPVHHEKFIDAASLADIVFTTDARMISSYLEKTGNKRIYALPFAAQPALHKPRALAGRRQRACFAGTWYGDRHSVRSDAIVWMLNAALPFGLDIFDRNHGTGNFQFPDEYRDHIRGGLPYEQLCAEYARYRVFLNVNSVTDSPTMFSRRVLELLACGTPVVSSYALGIEQLLGSDVVWMVKNEKQAVEAIQTLLTDDSEWRRRSLAGIRAVFSSHTYQHRLNEIYDKMGLKSPVNIEPRILVLAQARTEDDFRRLAEFHKRQSYRGFEMMVHAEHSLSGVSHIAPAIRVASESARQGEMIADLLRRENFNLSGWVNPEAGYGPEYLQDLVNATRYASDAVVWGKAAGDEEFTYEGQTNPYACLFKVSGELLRSIASSTGISPPKMDAINGPVFCLDREEFDHPQ